MAWSTSYDNSKILTIDEMNAAKSYNIFSSSSTKCPTKSEIQAASVVYAGSTYTVTISNASSFAANQLVPNTNLSPSATLNGYTINVQCSVYFTNPPTYDFAKNNWDTGGSGIYTLACDSQVTINTGTSGSGSYEAQDIIAEIYGETVAGGDTDTRLENCYANITAAFSVPSNVTIRSITVELFNGADAYCTYNLLDSQLDKSVNISFTDTGSLSQSNTDY